MRKFLALISLVILMLAGLFATSPATAESEKATHGNVAIPLTIFDSYKWTPHYTPQVPLTCIAIGDTTIPIAAAAQSWNNASTGPSITAENNCVSLGFEAWRRATVDTFHDPNWGSCYKMTNMTTSGTFGTYDTFRYHTQNPVGWVNTAYNCTSTAIARAHWTTFVIGRILGLKRLDGSTWASRVMCYCTQNTIGYAEVYSGDAVSKLYGEYYAGAY